MKADIILGADQRLSKSIIWEIQRQYFLKNGLKAWQDEFVPHYITSNPFVAKAYGRTIFGYLRDLTAVPGAIDLTQPIYIVELGAGSGRFAYHFLTRFFPMLKGSPLAELDVKLVLTDFVPKILDFWQSHERFQPWIEAGMLDFALFDAVDLRPIDLVNANQTLAPDTVTNPIILIANYFFDSIPQDSFAIVDDQLCENLLTLYSSQPEPDLADQTIWQRLKLAYERIPLQTDYYEVDIYNQILMDYEAILPDTVFPFPKIGLDCLRFWKGFGDGRCLLLSGDWGYSMPESLVNQEDPMPNMHGSFSMMVNYDAIGQYVMMEGGLVLRPPHYQDSLQVGAYLFGERPQNALETKLAFSEAISDFGPDDFYSLKEVMDSQYTTMTLAQLLSYLRLSNWDATLFEDMYTAFLAKAVEVSPAWYGDIYFAAARVWQGYLPLKGGVMSDGVFIEGDELERKIGRLLRVMGYEDRLEEFFSEI